MLDNSFFHQFDGRHLLIVMALYWWVFIKLSIRHQRKEKEKAQWRKLLNGTKPSGRTNG